MFRLPDTSDPLLGRPLAVYQAGQNQIGAVYITVGKMTRRLAGLKPDDPLELWLPLGNGFQEYDAQHTIIVAGGIGFTPFLMYCRNHLQQNRPGRISLLYGAKSQQHIACMDDFRQQGIELVTATDDGSEGHHGKVTDLIDQVYRPDETTQLLCCGPMPMLRTAFLTAKRLGLPCSVSLETPMSCGLGICFGCAVPYREEPGTDWDYRRTCVDGPVFDAYKLRWEGDRWQE